MRCLRPAVLTSLFLAALMLAAGPASAAGPHAGLTLLGSVPDAQSIIPGTDQQFSVRFDEPIRQDTARMVILRDEKVIRRLRPQQDSDTRKIFAPVAPLPPGEYVLRWHVVGVGRQIVKNGDIAFTVRAP